MAAYQRRLPGQVEGNWLAALAHGPALQVARSLERKRTAASADGGLCDRNVGDRPSSRPD